MANERQQKPADQPLRSIEIEEVPESRPDDELKAPIRRDRKRVRGRQPNG